MSYNMSNSRFPAVLKTLDDQIVADTGVIQISIEDKSVDYSALQALRSIENCYNTGWN